MAGKFNFTNKGSKQYAVDRGASFNRTFTWKDDSAAPNDLTGFNPVFSVSRSKGSKDLVVASVGNGRVTTNDALGVITVSLTVEDMNKLSYGENYYSLVLDGGPSATIRLLDGTFEVV